MFNLFRWSSLRVALLVLGMTTATVAPIVISTPALSQNTVPDATPSPSPAATPSPTSTVNLSDVTSDYWARPFIQTLADNNVISGFPDGSFRPNQSVTRAEFAALIQKAFGNQNRVRQLSAGGFSDVPAGYWAAAAIQNAYEIGFLSGYPGNVFRPNQQIPKVEAIVSISNGLGLSASDTSVLNTSYSDASAIPNYAVSSVAAATQANLVVNYPDVKQLNPQQALTRAEAAALLYQALVRQGRLQPIASNLPAAQYVVGGVGSGTQTGNDIVSLAASSNSFSTLTSLLKTAGLAETLQQPGPYTVFAPTNDAFAALPASTLEQLQQPQNREALIKILSYHVVPGAVTSGQLANGELKTFEERPVNIQIDRANNQVAVNNARVIQADVPASNGVIHAINQVLIPPDINLSQLNQPQNGGNANGGTSGVDVGRATRGGRSYIGVAGNIGLTGGDTALSEGNFTVISKLGLTNSISVRPSVLFGDDTVFLVPLTYDFTPRAAGSVGQRTLSIAPYLGAGVAIEANLDTDFGLLLTGGVDVPLGTRFTLTGAVNAAFMDETDVGLLLGVGYNF
ncbi:beta-Ig-H3/fasciclin [Nostoc linckia z18]|uniref:Beta-Ig-H3/fasciclin n=2 Tax=Nostoc linckia TaxID=92942 RepID=A0A9Q6EHH4_NOSLI|nr:MULTISPECIES: fasciclin domain-containing protein [Nostoc]MBL1198000.1 beta-Ig-H3/fasciclin [Nostoc sp. GBBB01]PHK27600.1 beta-Ig-H3/fasciclin [Nostoc linckia z15]PHK38300.1 beta-Ig-H3/fasciclin [Nostoc linckia z16]MBC1238457.1 fasciclin domain-containing protein [Nostoc sp. 2RC]PHJ56404.1 beta-Ig-H3/fasciclin [Nostoc linckia z1]